MKLRLCALLLALCLCGCATQGAAVASTPPASSDAENRQYLKNISFVVPEDWEKESALQGYYFIAPDGGTIYFHFSDYAPLDLAVAENAAAAIDKNLYYLESTLPGYDQAKAADRIFLDRPGREVWFTMESADGAELNMFALFFADRMKVYTLLFTLSSEDVQEAATDILASIHLG